MKRYRLYINTVIENTNTKLGETNKSEEQFAELQDAEARFLELITKFINDKKTIAYQLVILDKEENSIKYNSGYARQFVGEPMPYNTNS
jgi:hypothetical protein